MSQEGIEIIRMRTCEIVDRIAAEAGSGCAHLAHIRLLLHLVHS